MDRKLKKQVARNLKAIKRNPRSFKGGYSYGLDLPFIVTTILRLFPKANIDIHTTHKLIIHLPVLKIKSTTNHYTKVQDFVFIIDVTDLCEYCVSNHYGDKYEDYNNPRVYCMSPLDVYYENSFIHPHINNDNNYFTGSWEYCWGDTSTFDVDEVDDCKMTFALNMQILRTFYTTESTFTNPYQHCSSMKMRYKGFISKDCYETDRFEDKVKTEITRFTDHVLEKGWTTATHCDFNIEATKEVQEAIEEFFYFQHRKDGYVYVNEAGSVFNHRHTVISDPEHYKDILESEDHNYLRVHGKLLEPEIHVSSHIPPAIKQRNPHLINQLLKLTSNDIKRLYWTYSVKKWQKEKEESVYNTAILKNGSAHSLLRPFISVPEDLGNNPND